MLSTSLISFVAFFALTAVAKSDKAAPATATAVYDPSSAVSLIDYQPAFLTPTGDEVWVAGQEYSASWTQTIPAGINQSEVAQSADIMMGWKSLDPSNVSLHINWTLATNVSLYAPAPNTVSFTLPQDLPFRSTYILLLLGSTRATTEEFTIVPFVPTATKKANLLASLR